MGGRSDDRRAAVSSPQRFVGQTLHTKGVIRKCRLHHVTRNPLWALGVLPFFLFACAASDVVASRPAVSGVEPTSAVLTTAVPTTAVPTTSAVPTTAVPTTSAVPTVRADAASGSSLSRAIPPTPINAESDFEKFDFDTVLIELAPTVRKCVRDHVEGPGIDSITRWMVATETMPGSSAIESLILSSLMKGSRICNREAEISDTLRVLLADISPSPMGESRCALNRAYDWLEARPEDSFLLDQWGFDDEPAHDALLAAVASCGLHPEFFEYLLNPARNPIRTESGEIAFPILELE